MADTTQTIQGFYTQAQARDFARNNLFRVLNINFGFKHVPLTNTKH